MIHKSSEERYVKCSGTVLAERRMKEYENLEEQPHSILSQAKNSEQKQR